MSLVSREVAIDVGVFETRMRTSMSYATQSVRRNHPAIRDLNSQMVSVDHLRPLGRDTRRHPQKQIVKLARSLHEFGFVQPILIDEERRVIAGWALVQAARHLEFPEVPAVTLSGLTASQARALRLALNRLGEDSNWDRIELGLELGEISADIDLELTGFDTPELDIVLKGEADDEEDELPEVSEAEPTTKPGDLWILGSHRIYCGDALVQESYERLLSDEKATMVFTDPPYNVRVTDISGLGRHKHEEFAMASGEMSSGEYRNFLRRVGERLAANATDGSIHYVCIDWRHINDLVEACGPVFAELKNVCVWTKPAAGMGSLYRSQHEFVAVFKSGTGPHINNIELGRHGRDRSNVWSYAGQGSFNGTAKSKLALHPTVKPVALVADAIRDCSNRGDLLLDPFGGAGTTLIAAERAGRRAALVEIDPAYVDVTVRRWQWLTGQRARHGESGAVFPKDQAGREAR